MRTRVNMLLAILMAFAPLCLSGCGKEEAVVEKRLRPVRFQPVFATGGSRVRSFSGAAQAAVESQLSFRVGGSIQRLHVQVGDNVREGQLIAELDPTDYRIQVEESRAALEEASSAAQRAASDYDRVRSMYEERNASKADLDAARAQDQSAKARVTAAEQRLQLSETRLGYTKLKSPIAGSIAEVMVDVNENIDQGKSVVLLTSGSRLEVVVGIPEILISSLREGDAVTVSFDALPNRTFGARITEVGVAATGAVTTFPVTVRLDQSDPDVRPGMAAEVAFEFQSSDPRERFVVPPVAVGEDRKGRHVFVVTRTGPETGVVERRPVSVGELTSDGLEVFDGLFDGDLLITAGVTKLHGGMEVRLPLEESAS